ncbi:sialidase-1 [Calidifontibacter indicus]|uniref:exo-alpha-sialidase n=1 Tax=Calidifontibacter indicus TaxID=419650 RepID=A0A3D9UMQ7_9MICO|nr:sialidase-1 [Calidifontibacter indicus]
MGASVMASAHHGIGRPETDPRSDSTRRTVGAVSGSTSFERVVAARGHDGYRQYRIPALAVSPRGTLSAAYDGRPNLDDLPNPIDLLLRRSFDGGRTWQPQQVVRTGVGLEGFGDPSLLVDNETGRIFMFHAAGTKAGFFESGVGVEPADEAQHVDLSWSDDDGQTWQHRRITGELKAAASSAGGVSTRAARKVATPGSTGENMAGIFAASGVGIQIHTGPFAGRLVQQFVVLVDGKIRAVSGLSDDHGDTWRLGSLIGPSADGVDPNENKVVCLADGRLLWHSRAYPVRLQAISTDGGETWSTPTPVRDLPDPSDNGSVARFDGLPQLDLARPETDTWLIASHNHDTALRRNTVLRLSTDEGRTWPHTLSICAGSSAYSTVQRLPDGRIGVLYERQGYTEIVFTSIDAQQLIDAGELPADGRRPFAFDLVLRSITPGRPDTWQHVGEFHVVPTAVEGVDRRAWKEVGQAYGAEGQVIGTREAQDLNYGPPRPGYRAGDLLTFAGRVRNTGDEPLVVELTGPDVPAEIELEPGQEFVLDASYQVTPADIARGEVVVEFTASAGGVDRRTTHRFDTETGAVQVV